MARFLLANSDLGEANAEVFALLEGITKNEGEAGHEALIVGLLSGVVPAGERPEWLRRLRAHPLATEQSFLIADAIEVEANPSFKPCLVAAMIDRVYGKSLDDRLLAVRWLLRHGEPSQVEKILPLDQARSRPDAFSLWIEGQAAMGKWQAVLAAADQNPQAFAPGAQRLLRGQALKKTGRADEGRQEYLRGLAECGGDPARLVPALAFLQSDGEREIFHQHIQPLLASEATALPTIQQLAPLIAQGGDAKALRDLLACAAAGPLSTYPVLLNDMACLDLVMGVPVDHTEIARRAANFPENHAFRFTQALSQLRQGRKAEALQTAENPRVRIQDLAPPQQLALACILAANGQSVKAAHIRAILQVSPLTRQERVFLDSGLHQ